MSLLFHAKISLKDIFEFNEDRSRVYLKCDHKNENKNLKNFIPYSGNIMFSFKPIFEIIDNNDNKIDENRTNDELNKNIDEANNSENNNDNIDKRKKKINIDYKKNWDFQNQM